MAGLRGAYGDFGGLKIANFTYQDDIGVMAEDGAQARGKGEADLFAHLDLHRAFELVFDGVFKGNDLAAFIIGLSQGGIERGGFAAPGWPGQ